MDEQFKTVENLLIKQESMLQENRRLIEDLKNRVLISDLVIILLSITILIQLIK